MAKDNCKTRPCGYAVWAMAISTTLIVTTILASVAAFGGLKLSEHTHEELGAMHATLSSINDTVIRLDERDKSDDDDIRTEEEPREAVATAGGGSG